MEAEAVEEEFHRQVLLLLRELKRHEMMRLMVLTALVVMLVSCGGMETAPGEVAHKPSTKSSTNAGMDKVLLKAMRTPADREYVLGPEDLLDIDVFQVDELKKTVRVSAKGNIKLPLVGKIRASGLTIPELEDVLAKKLSRFIQNPEVSVFIKEFRSQHITLLGAVRKQQVYTVSGQNYLLDIISRADGLSEDAGEICYVQRGKETIIIDMRDLLYEGNTQLNIPVFGGDVVYIPRGGTVFVSGAVKGPGSFPVKGTVTLTQSIAMAKNFEEYAIKGRIRVYRDIGKGQREIIEANYNDILENESPDVELQDKDVVIVPASNAAKFFLAFVRSLRGLVNFSDDFSVGAGFED